MSSNQTNIKMRQDKTINKIKHKIKETLKWKYWKQQVPLMETNNKFSSLKTQGFKNKLDSQQLLALSK